jgi:hypothetical protein
MGGGGTVTLVLPHLNLTLARDHAEPGEVYRAEIDGASLEIRHTPLARVRYVAELRTRVEGRTGYITVDCSGRTLSELEIELRDCVRSEAGADALTCMSARKSRAA